MKSLRIYIRIIFVATTITLMLYCVYVFRESSPNNFSRPEDAESVEMGSRSSSGANALKIRTGEEDGDVFHKVLGPKKIPMDMPKEVVMERIENGLSRMVPERVKVYPDEEISSIEHAYKRMIGTIIFMNSAFPEWGVDHGSYFVFSGQPSIGVDLAFNYAYVVKKEDGTLYRWWYSQEELEESRSNRAAAEAQPEPLPPE